MYREAVQFNKVALPIFLVICVFMFLIGCGGVADPTFTGKVYTEPTTIEGLHFFKEQTTGQISGALGVTIDYQGRVDVEEVETFRSSNFNGSFGVHPRVGFSNVSELPNGLVVFAGDVTYTAANDLEEDGNTSDLAAGKHYTVYTLSLTSTNSLVLRIQVHQGNLASAGGINSILIDRTFEEL